MYVCVRAFVRACVHARVCVNNGYDHLKTGVVLNPGQTILFLQIHAKIVLFMSAFLFCMLLLVMSKVN